ncbi:MAG: hypothetical protein FWB94_01990 [Chitinispirillia bacterium]|nr:hypothetical protein [Chitinispirillia bacterium]
MAKLPTDADILPPSDDHIFKTLLTREEVGMAATLLQEISKDEQERARFRSRRMFETDITSNILTAEDNGRRKGEAQAQINIAKKLKAEGVDVDTISRSTGLTVDEILKLAN